MEQLVYSFIERLFREDLLPDWLQSDIVVDVPRNVNRLNQLGKLNFVGKEQVHSFGWNIFMQVFLALDQLAQEDSLKLSLPDEARVNYYLRSFKVPCAQISVVSQSIVLVD